MHHVGLQLQRQGGGGICIFGQAGLELVRIEPGADARGDDNGNGCEQGVGWITCATGGLMEIVCSLSLAKQPQHQGQYEQQAAEQTQTVHRVAQRMRFKQRAGRVLRIVRRVSR